MFTGVIEGSGNKNGVDWSLESVSDGTGIWYFAHKEGILVSDVTDGTADGSIIVNAPDGEMVMPISRVYTMSTELVQ